MKQYETVLSVNGQLVEPQSYKQSLRKAFTGLGVATSVLVLGAVAILFSNAELRSQVFFSAPVQAIFAAELDLVSTGLAAGGVEVNDGSNHADSTGSSSNGMMPVKFNSIDSSKPLTAGQRQITSYLAKRYSVSPEAVESIVRLAYKVGKEEKVEPTLILAIVGIESSYNPFAASPVGARGLMQIMPKIHKDKFEALSPGDWSPLNPEMNMRVGAKIIREYTRRTGSVNAGLRWYVGAAIHGNDGGYPGKVLALKSRIDSVHQQGQMVASRGNAEKVSAVTVAGTEG
ncbi:lytic transglycosylase domain-containing protein [Limnobacter parvus]|uniref:Lytic transglycosylase domain-containing protein n=1 Tax=Limnobacter parvus TaxID=2939690 RepID=A0ABT1XHC2_9BURK|nr:lytic transglycosylase domain-containing protein [Limnobacter parvus]MCR2746289.1 lytic transglycosylase domain-containing protein [Limnobacter parvus]